MKKDVIPYGKQYIDQDDIDAVVNVLKSDYLTTGPKIEEFEQAFAAKVGARFAVAISNGTAALHAAAFALDLKQGDEVITTPMTFAATANAALYVGAKPVFVDIDPQTYNINPALIEQAITPNTKAIFVVHFTGQPCDMDSISAIAKKHNLYVVEDAAHALGATYNGQTIGSISNLTTFSLHPVKHITTGEGGMVTTNDEKLYKRLKLFRSHGITRDVEEWENPSGPWYYEQQSLGYNYRLTDIQAALGLSQLKKLDLFVERRRQLAKQYDTLLQDVNHLRRPIVQELGNPSWHLYVVWIDFNKIDSTRDDFFKYMKSKNILLNVHYIPVYKHPYYQVNGYANVSCKQAEIAYEGFVSLPLFYGLSDSEQEYVVTCLKDYINK